MNAESLFVACYCALLLVGALGLERFGRIQAGRRGSLVATPPPNSKDTGTEAHAPSWPQVESVHLHGVMAFVAVLAAMLLLIVEMIRHHDLVDLTLLGLVAVGGAAISVRFGRTVRHFS